MAQLGETLIRNELSGSVEGRACDPAIKRYLGEQAKLETLACIESAAFENIGRWFRLYLEQVLPPTET